MQKNPKLRTIVNKLDNIHAQFRYFDMEVIAGEADFITTCSESDCIFTFDFSKVYWNSRLQREHDRLVDLLAPGSVVVDAMAGVGPFAVPAAKKGCFVLGNDLNPESVKWMRKNRLSNKVEGTLRVTELDGGEFIRQSSRMVWDEPFPPWVSPAELRKRATAARKEREARKKLQEMSIQDGAAAASSTSTPPAPLPAQEQEAQAPLEPQLPQHYIMNLPDSALEFLGSFQGVLSDVASEPQFETILSKTGLPIVHVYCFTRELDFETAQKDICEVSDLDFLLFKRGADLSAPHVTSDRPSHLTSKHSIYTSFAGSRQIRICTASPSGLRARSFLRRGQQHRHLNNFHATLHHARHAPSFCTSLDA